MSERADSSCQRAEPAAPPGGDPPETPPSSLVSIGIDHDHIMHTLLAGISDGDSVSVAWSYATTPLAIAVWEGVVHRVRKGRAVSVVYSLGEGTTHDDTILPHHSLVYHAVSWSPAVAPAITPAPPPSVRATRGKKTAREGHEQATATTTTALAILPPPATEPQHNTEPPPRPPLALTLLPARRTVPTPDRAPTPQRPPQPPPQPIRLPNVPRDLLPWQRGPFGEAAGNLLRVYPLLDIEERGRTVRGLLRYPSVALGSQAATSARKRAIPQLTLDDILSAPDLLPEGDDDAPRGRKAPMHPDDVSASTRDKVHALASKGHLRKAAMTLLQVSPPFPANDTTLLRELRALHPLSPLPICERPRSLPILSKEIAPAIKRMRRAKAPGPSGWTEELLATLPMTGPIGEGLRAMLTDIATGALPKDVRRLLAASTLIALPKPNGKVRPIAMGEVFLRAATRLTLLQYRVCWGPHQFAFVPAGTERIGHLVRERLGKGEVGMSLDMSNAFNTLARGPMLVACRDLAPQLFALAQST